MKTILNNYTPVFEKPDESNSGGEQKTETFIQDATKETETKETSETKTEEENPEEAETKEEEKPQEEEAVLTAEDIKLPEGFEVASEELNSFVELMNDKEMSIADKAQKLVDIQTGMVQKAAEHAQNEFVKTIEDWRKSTMEHEALKENFDAKMAMTNQFLSQYVDEEFNQIMAATGAGNHPAVVSALVKIAETYSEGSPLAATEPASNSEKTAAEKMFKTT